MSECSPAPPIRWRLFLFGPMRAEHDGRPMAVVGQKQQLLLAFLILNPNTPRSRDYLADLLWPDAPPERVRRNLSTALHRLRQTIGHDLLALRGMSVVVRQDPARWVDVAAFEHLVESTDQSSLEEAVSLYTGELLPDLDADWLLIRRVELHERYLDCLLRLATATEEQNQPARALRYYQRLVAADPLHEAGRQGLMRVFARMGRPTNALQQYAQFAQLLAAELKSRPSPETQALAAAIQAEIHAPVTGDERATSFVGRRYERAHLLSLIERVLLGRGGVVLVEGQPGIGKTRLLEQVAASAHIRGVTVCWGRARELDAVTPYTPLAQALQMAIVGPRVAQINARLTPPAVAALAGLVPQLSVAPAMQFSTPPDIPAAVITALAALSAIAPHLLILDDVHWADLAFWSVLARADQLLTLPIMIVLIYRSDEIRTDPVAWERLCALERDLAPSHLALEGLSPDECDGLAHELGHALQPAQLAALHQATRGNPLFLQKALRSPDGGLSLQNIIRQQLAALSPTARTLLELAAVLGRAFEHHTWQAIGGAQLLVALPELIGLDLLRETPTGHSFGHDLIRTYVYEAIAPGDLRRLHEQVGALLSRQDGEPLAAAWHLERAELWDQAVLAYQRAGEREFRAYLYDSALQSLDRALALVQRMPATRASTLELALRRDRQRVLLIVGKLDLLRDELAVAEALALANADEGALLAVLETRVALLALDARGQELAVTAERALALARDLGERAAEARILRTYAMQLVAISAVPPAHALALLERSVRLAEAVHDEASLVAALCTLAFTQRLVGTSAVAYQTASRALALAQTRPYLYPARAEALRTLAEINMARAEWESAQATMQTAIALLEQLRDRWSAGIAYFMGAVTCYSMGLHNEAQQHVEKLYNLIHAGHLKSDSGWGMYVHTVAIDAATQAGNLAAAEQIARRVQPLIEGGEDSQATLFLMTAIGALRLYQNRPREALALLSRAKELWRQTPSSVLTPLLLHATATALLGEQAAAAESLELAERTLAGGDVALYRIPLSFSRFLLYGERRDLQAAHGELQRQAGLFKDDRLRDAFLRQVRLNQLIARLWQLRAIAQTLRGTVSLWMQLSQLYQPAPRHGPNPDAESAARLITVTLARLDAPLGKSLQPDKLIEVRWTLVDPGDALLLDKAARRQRRLQRLIEEAAAQGAAPTDDDLARTLGVSRRTILRDMRELSVSGVRLPTRRRRA